MIKRSILPPRLSSQIAKIREQNAAIAAKRNSLSFSPRVDYTAMNPEISIPQNASPGSPEYEATRSLLMAKYGKDFNKSAGDRISGDQFMPVTDNLKEPIPIPSDYSQFATPASFTENGEKLSWGTPSKPQIRNMSFDGQVGQYVEDANNKSLLVKTTRGTNRDNDDAIRGNIPGFMGTIDHIMPLSLGGADTAENRQLLNPEENFRKTKAQAIAYTLYAHGDITLDKARIMAMEWKNADISDIPKPNTVGLISDSEGGKTGIEIAREKLAHWYDAKPVTAKDVIGGIPEAAKNWGKGFLPDPIREFGKGLVSGGTAGFVPYEIDSDESIFAKASGITGLAIGTLVPWSLATKALLLPFKAYRGASAVLATRKAFTIAEAAKAVEATGEATGGATSIANKANALKSIADGVNVAENTKTIETVFKTVNTTPNYLTRAINNPDFVKQLGTFAGTSAVFGQGQQFIANKFNPDIISGKQLISEQDSVISNIIKDSLYGAVTGVASPTIKGTAYSVMVPTTLSFLANPDDPTDAIVNGLVFGAMHAHGTYKKPGYNNIEALGGNKYKNPITVDFNNAVDNLSYASLSHYAPEYLPELKPGQKVPSTAHNQEYIQKVKDKAIENVFNRLFFGKDLAPETVSKSLSSFKQFASGIESKIDSLKPTKLSFLNKFSLSARKDAYKAGKAQDATISKEFGKDYQTRNEYAGDKTMFAEDNMDLQTALTEVKRIVAASRQLYKGGLVGEMRNKADVDDLLSFSKDALTSRANAQDSYLNPPVAKKAVDAIDDSFMENSFNNDTNPASGKYPDGTVTITGFGLDKNNPKVASFLADKANSSPNLIVVDRSDMAPLFSMRNKLINPKDIADGTHAIDLHPENALQVFGVKWVVDPATKQKTGQKEIVDLGFVASEHRRETGKYAFNNQQFVKDYIETNGEKGLPPLKYNKDDIANAMRENNLKVLVMNIDPMSTPSTTNKKSFLVGNLKDKNWIYSKQLGDRLAMLPDENHLSMSISGLETARNAGQKSAAIAEINKKIVKPASSRIPISDTTSLTANRVTVPQEATRGILISMEQALEAPNPGEVKKAFKENFDILLEDTSAQEIFDKRNNMTMREGVKTLVDAVNSENVSVATKLKLDFMKTYIESGILQSNALGKATIDLPIKGKMKNIQYTGQEDVINNNNTRDTVQDRVDNSLIPSNNSNIENTQPTVILTVPENKLVDNIVSAAKEELPANDKNGPVTSRKMTPEEMTQYGTTSTKSREGSSANEMVTRAKKIIEETNPQGGGKYTPIDPDTGVFKAGRGAEMVAESMISKIKQIEPANVTTDEAIKIKKEIEPHLLSDVAYRLRDIFDMPIEDAQSLVNTLNKENIITKKKTTTAEVKQDSPKLNFVEKNPLTKTSDYDVLKNRRFKSGDELITWAKKGLENSEPGSYSHSFSHTLNSWLSDNFGKNYAKDDTVRELLGRAFGTEGVAKKLFKNYFETSNTKQDLQGFDQSKDVINALATGNKGSKLSAELKRMRALQEAKYMEGKVTESDLTNSGIGKGELDANRIRISKNPVEEDMIKNLSKADFQLLPGVTSIEMAGESNKGPGAVRKGVEDARNIMQFIVKAHNDSIKASKPFNGKVSKLNQTKLFLNPKFYKGSFSNLSPDQVKEVNKKTDEFFNDIYKKYMDRLNVQEGKKTEFMAAKSDVIKLKQQWKTLTKALEDPEERSNWQTPEIIQSNVENVMKNLRRALKIIDETTKHPSAPDGTGGPGYPDGRGGWLSDLGGYVNKAVSTVGNSIGDMWSNLNTPAKAVFYGNGNQDTQPAAPVEQSAPTTPKTYSSFTGTNYDPYHTAQNRPDSKKEDIGKGASGIFIDDSMAATSLKKDGITGNLRMGTVIWVPELKKKFLIADTMNKRFNGQNKIDLATPHTGSEIIPAYNKNFDIVVLREGKGAEDARNLVNSGEWDNIKRMSVD
jgi:hypothetical protein